MQRFCDLSLSRFILPLYKKEALKKRAALLILLLLLLLRSCMHSSSSPNEPYTVLDESEGK